jgi:hypothetical protein
MQHSGAPGVQAPGSQRGKKIFTALKTGIKNMPGRLPSPSQRQVTALQKGL